MEIRHILVPTDFSPDAEVAVQQAVELAKAFKARVTLLHAYHVPLPVLPAESYSIPADLIDSVRDAAKSRLAELEGQVSQSGLEVGSELSAEPPSLAIVDAAERLGVDLIVMGTRGLTGLKHVVLGSIAERTLRHAPCPVLTVKS